ncbi:MAG: glycosyltransferase [Oligoflexia bacterium]|nr:glycosyltransferase [Oligoflexia bacterium]
MRVVLFHPTELPPRDYGGVERVVLWLARGLVERGHEVWVGALPGSRLPEGARLLEIPENDRSALSLAPRLPEGTDVVHFMAPPEPGAWEQLPCAGLLTVHGNGRPGEAYPLNSVFLSADHARRHGGNVFVYNGIDPSEYRFAPKEKEDWFLFLSKTSWSVKNLAGAMRLCAEAEVPLRIAGGSRPVLRRLQAFLRPQMRWMGPVAGEAKAELLARARALLFPVLWPEPFGLVVVEALISGTPVLASRKGSLPELVPADVGVTLPVPEKGRDKEWQAILVSEMLGIEPERCREWALSKFHYARMAEAYEGLYRDVSGGKTLHLSPPLVHDDWRQQ